MKRTRVKGTVYLIHFDRPLAHAQHYIGWTENLDARLRSHARGSGARLLRAVNAAGIEWSVVRTWTGVDRHFERRLKRRKNAARLCPICRGEAAPLPLLASLETVRPRDAEAVRPGPHRASWVAERP